jgi:hypothetical protein
MQSTLNRSDRRIERIAHLQQGLSTQVERLQRLAVQLTQSLNSCTDVVGLFAFGRVLVRRIARAQAGCFQHERVARHCRLAPSNSIDRHAMNDSSQPSAECLWHSQLVQLLHRLDEYVLGQLFRFVRIADTFHRQRNNPWAITLEELSECVTVTRLSGANQAHNGKLASVLF